MIRRTVSFIIAKELPSDSYRNLKGVLYFLWNFIDCDILHYKVEKFILKGKYIKVCLVIKVKE